MTGTDEPGLPRRSPESGTFARRALVTVAALAALAAGRLIPVAGLDSDTLLELSRSSGSSAALERVSILTLGLMPFLSALILGEILTLASPRLRSWRASPKSGSFTYVQAMIVLGLIFAFFQASAVAGALESIAFLVGEPGPAFRLTTAATLTAGTALVIWLAHVIGTHGLGNGVWWLLIAPSLAKWPQDILSVKALMDLGRIPLADVWLMLALPAGIIVLAVWLVEARRNAGECDPAPLVWPPLVAGVLMGWLIGGGLLLPAGGPQETWLGLLQPGQPLFLAVYGALVGGLALLYAADAHDTTVARTGALVLIGAVIAPEAARAHLGWPISAEGVHLIILAVLAIETLRQWRGQNGAGGRTGALPPE